MTQRIDGKVIGRARDVKTKYGMRSVVDVLTAEGQKLPVWKAMGDASIGRLCDGERVTLTLDDKGAVQTIEGSYDRVQAQRAANPISPVIETTIPNRPMGFTVGLPMEAERQLSRQIGAIQKSTVTPVVDSIEPSTIQAQLDQYSSVFRMCLARAEMLSPSNSEALALEMFKGLASKLAA
jgi:hypothetical protein